MSFEAELLQSVREALAIAEGKASPAAVFNPNAAGIAAVQERVREAGFSRLSDEKSFLDDLSGGI